MGSAHRVGVRHRRARSIVALPALRVLVIGGYLVTHEPTLARPEVQRFIRTLQVLRIPADALVPPDLRASVGLGEQLVTHAKCLAHLAEITVFGVEDDEAGDLASAHEALPKLVIERDRIALADGST